MDLKYPESRRWLEFWDRLRGDRSAPLSADADPIANVPEIIDRICWVEVLDDGDFLYRVAGTLLREHFGFELTGRRLSGIDFQGFEHEIRALFTRVSTRCEAEYMRGFYTREDKKQTAWEASILPFVDTKGRVDRILVGMAYTKKF